MPGVPGLPDLGKVFGGNPLKNIAVPGVGGDGDGTVVNGSFLFFLLSSLFIVLRSTSKLTILFYCLQSTLLEELLPSPSLPSTD